MNYYNKYLKHKNIYFNLRGGAAADDAAEVDNGYGGVIPTSDELVDFAKNHFDWGMYIDKYSDDQGPANVDPQFYINDSKHTLEEFYYDKLSKEDLASRFSKILEKFKIFSSGDKKSSLPDATKLLVHLKIINQTRLNLDLSEHFDGLIQSNYELIKYADTRSLEWDDYLKKNSLESSEPKEYKNKEDGILEKFFYKTLSEEDIKNRINSIIRSYDWYKNKKLVFRVGIMSQFLSGMEVDSDSDQERCMKQIEKINKKLGDIGGDENINKKVTILRPLKVEDLGKYNIYLAKLD